MKIFKVSTTFSSEDKEEDVTSPELFMLLKITKVSKTMLITYIVLLK